MNLNKHSCHRNSVLYEETVLKFEISALLEKSVTFALCALLGNSSEAVDFIKRIPVRAVNS